MFRDETETLRARIMEIEPELERARARLAELETVAEERDTLARRVAELERELERLRPKRREKKRPPAAAAATTTTDAPAKGMRVGALVALLVVGGIAAAVGRYAWKAASWSRNGGDHAPTLGMIDLDRTPAPAAIAATARGEHRAWNNCRGYLPTAPQLVLRASRPTVVRITTESSADLVMAIRTADGRVLCDDDSGQGSNPLLRTVLVRGDHRIWIGTYGNNGAAAALRILVSTAPADATPDGSGLATAAPPTMGTFVVPPAGDGASLSGPVNPTVVAETVHAGCRGVLPMRPQATVVLSSRMAVNFTARAPRDLVMLVRTADGRVLCDDDSGPGNYPRVATVLGPGEHRVWVGVFSDDGTPTTDASLSLDARPLDPQAQPTLGLLRVGAEPVESHYTGLAAGVVDAHTFGAACGGLMPTTPSLAVQLASARDVLLQLQPSSGVLLLVRHPNGAVECGPGASPVPATWQAGVHQVFVGVAEEAEPSAYGLTVRATSPSVVPWSPR
jgi:hypothetical protein